MVAKLEYDSYVRRLLSASVAAFAISVLLLPATAHSQINGVPASVTSINFGGHFNLAPGPPASVTSLGPNGVQGESPFFGTVPCCVNPLISTKPNPPLFSDHHRHHVGNFFPGGGVVYAVPYAVPYPVPVDSAADNSTEPEEDYQGGPTIFDRHGSAWRSRSANSYWEKEHRPPADVESSSGEASERATQAPQPAVDDQPRTVLVFKDGHTQEVQNYAVVDNMLYDLSPGQHRKIALADLDLNATEKQNDDRGIDFQVPPKSQAR
jgi:hypothetical protein